MLNFILRLVEIVFFPESRHSLRRSAEAWLVLSSVSSPLYCSSIFLQSPLPPEAIPHLWEYGILVVVLVAAVIALWRRQVKTDERIYKLLKELSKTRIEDGDDQ